MKASGHEPPRPPDDKELERCDSTVGEMRIGLVCPYSLSADGGVQHQVSGLARSLTRLGHFAELIAPGEVASGISAGRAFPFRVNGSIARMAPHPAAAVRTVRALRGGDFDIVHLHEPLAPSITIPALLAHPAAVVGTFHAAGDRTPYRWFGPPMRQLARRIDVRVAVSESAAELARKYLGGTYEVLFNGIELDEFGDVPPVAVDGPTVLFLGRHERRKGLDVLLAAVQTLPPDVTVWIAGDGPETERVGRNHSADRRVHWLGRLSETDKVRHLRSASVLCAPSLHGESFGMVLLEAMAAGTPIVASDLPGYRQASGYGKCAELVAPGDVRALAIGLQRVLTDRQYADALRARGTDWARRHSMDELARRYVAIYEQLL